MNWILTCSPYSLLPILAGIWLCGYVAALATIYVLFHTEHHLTEPRRWAIAAWGALVLVMWGRYSAADAPAAIRQPRTVTAHYVERGLPRAEQRFVYQSEDEHSYFVNTDSGTCVVRITK